MATKTCKTCKKTKDTAKFRMVSTRPAVFSPECILCLANKNAPDSTVARREQAERIKLEEQLTREMASREYARRKLIHYTERFEKNYSVGFFHDDVAARLERFIKKVELKQSPRLILCGPPRVGKSKLVSENLPSYALGHHPEWEIINASYASSLPLTFSKRIRERMRSKEYRSIFKDTHLDPENQSIDGWFTTAGGGYLPVGVGGSITGRGCHILTIDDPLKDREEADSEVIRKKVVDWYGSTAYTRLYPGAGVLIMATRWHDADLIGHLLEQEAELRREGAPDDEIENWEVVSYPAIAEEDEYIEKGTAKLVYVPGAELENKPVRKKGEALHPARYDLKKLLRIKRNLAPRDWLALYQQSPQPSEGEMFKKDYMRTYVPPLDWGSMTPLLAGDLAIGVRQINDYTVLGVGFMNSRGDLYVPEIIRARMKADAIAEAVTTLVRRYAPQVGYIEYGQLWLAIKPTIDEKMEKARLFLAWDEELKPTTDKVARARTLEGMMQQGRVHFPKDQPWVATVEHELLRFPNGVHDDCVDFLAWLAILAKKTPLPTRAAAPKPESWRDKLDQYTQGDRPIGYLAA